MSEFDRTLPLKRVVCHFGGGNMDGAIASDSEDAAEASFAKNVYTATHGGDPKWLYSGVSLEQFQAMADRNHPSTRKITR
ncbi:hypothetical protein N9Y42_07795 [Mariniblastus sp.]|nr:hypothetical protein [Mariniblastus sp.]